ncbi:protein shortage in chiasmata 1 ortholog [Pyxicephalus adspersus]|uniref:protein shortage in chiasmata 1 ortholog n=1 Tax=Pyxicephalus adspersus TaxID=30357 RepID=UPI003B5AF8D8
MPHVNNPKQTLSFPITKLAITEIGYSVSHGNFTFEMKKATFPAFKFLALDYAFENVMKQNISMSWMLIPFPNGILQEEDYCHTKVFVNDMYRTPWKTSIPTFNIQETDSILDMWKANASTDFLERKEEALAIVPSSNPCSPTDLEDVCLITESCADEASHTDKYWKIIPSDETECYLLPEEAVFVDCLTQYRQHLPSLSTLQNRLKTIPVEDPLPDWKETLPDEELLFRMDTFVEKDLEPDFLLEDFHPLIQNGAEHLSLPYIVEMDEDATARRFSISDLITVLQLAPEDMLETVSEGLLSQISSKQELIEQNTTDRNIDIPKYKDIVEKVCFSLYHVAELEVTFSPPHQAFKETEKEQSINLDEEVLSPICSTYQCVYLLFIYLIILFYISFYNTGRPEDILEYLESDAAIQFPLLKDPYIPVVLPHYTIDQLIEQTCIETEKLVDMTLVDNWWNKFGLPDNHDTIIETLDSDSTTLSLDSKIMSVTKITPDQLERILEENNTCFQQEDNFLKTGTRVKAHSSSPPQIIVPCPPIHTQGNVTLSIDSCGADNTIISYNEDCQLDKSPSFPKGHNVKQSAPSTSHTLSLGDFSEEHKWQDIGIKGPGVLENDDVDPLASFIILRTKRSLDQYEEKHTDTYPEQVSDAENRQTQQIGSHDLSSDAVSHQEFTEGPKHQAITVPFTASESQCQAYRVLHAAAVPVLNKLTVLGVSACAEWKFATVCFDSTRFLLCQQERNVTNRCKTGQKKNKDIIIFKNASFLHILVTLRDLILMCTLDAALEYLCNAKNIYKSVLESCLNDVWRKLRIIQYVKDKTKETDPKITALLELIEEAYTKQKELKILILSRMDSEAIKETINNYIEKTKGLKAIFLCPVNGNAFLDPENVLDSLRNYSYVIVNNQYIGSNFPWAHFSLVIENDCTDVWLKLCQDLNVSHITLKSHLPDLSAMDTSTYGEKEFLLHIQIPYIFLSSEDLTIYPEILNLLESRYNMTFIERECSPSLQLFGKASRCALITVDESTVIILQSLEGLMPDKSAENLILKLVALSLQYSCCWLLFYVKERLNSEYNFAGTALHSVVLVYAAITAYLSKSDDLQIKTFISTGIDNTGLLVRRIADHTLMLSASDPYKWLDKSWLSILPTEEERGLLLFPSVNPLVAQRMLSRGPSLQWLLSANKDQLGELFPEIPSKVIKHFSDITALHKLSTSAASHRPFEISVPAAREDCISHDNIQISLSDIDKHNSCNALDSSKTKLGSSGLLKPVDIRASNNVSKSSHLSEEDVQQNYQDSAMRNNQIVKQTQLSSKFSPLQSCQHATKTKSMRFSHKYYSEATFLSFSKQQNRTAQAQNVSEQYYQQSTNELPSHKCSPDMLSSEEDGILSQHNYYGTQGKSNFSVHREHIFANESGHQNSTNSVYSKNRLEDVICLSKETTAENPSVYLQCGSEDIYSPFPLIPNNEHLDDLTFSEIASTGKRKFTINNVTAKETIAGIQLSQQKRRKLIYEKVPGRCDGQTRLKFF